MKIDLGLMALLARAALHKQGKKLVQAMDDSPLSQPEMAELWGMSHVTVHWIQIGMLQLGRLKSRKLRKQLEKASK